jgi:hypothetical protein
MNEIIAAFDTVVDFVVEHGCPCAFPRVLHMLTFDPVEAGMGPYQIDLTQKLINAFPSPPDGDGLIRGPTGGEMTCSKCSSIFRLRENEFSINMNYLTCELVELEAEAIGAEVVLPVPLIGGARTFRKPGKEDRLTLTFSNANDEPQTFVRYMTELAQPEPS